MIDKIKKHWFVVIVAIIFLAGIIYFTNEQINSVLKGKRVDGKDVISEVDNKNLLADEYYELLLDKYGDAEIYKLFEKASLAAIPSKEEDIKQAEEDAKMQIQYISAEQGAAGLENLDKALIALGYSGKDELNILYEDFAKKEAIISEYIDDNFDKYAKPFMESEDPRIVSHILINMDNSDKPTDEEQKKIDKINAALKDGQEFGKVAMEFSDDPQTAPQKGLLGYMDKNTEYQEEFLKSALSLKDGETGTWIKTSYGQHLVHVESSKYEDLKKESGFVEAMMQQYPSLQMEAIWKKAKDLNIEFQDKDIEARLMKYMGIKGDKQ